MESSRHAILVSGILAGDSDVILSSRVCFGRLIEMHLLLLDQNRQLAAKKRNARKSQSVAATREAKIYSSPQRGNIRVYVL